MVGFRFVGFRGIGNNRGIGNTSLKALRAECPSDKIHIHLCPEDIRQRVAPSEAFQRLERREPNERSDSWRR